LDYYYDMEHLNWTLSTFCPQMKLHWSLDDLYDVPIGGPVTISVSDLGLSLANGTVLESPEMWTYAFQQLLATRSDPKTRAWPFKVVVSRSMFVWPTNYDDPAFVTTFGHMFRSRKDARRLAASALFTLRRKWLKSQSSSNAIAVGAHGFVGIHLRTERDVWGSEFPGYDEQAAYYLDYILQSPFRVAYLASGATPENITAFTEQARHVNITVVTKTDLLEIEDLQYLATLTWDQQAIVDFELLLRSNMMAGVSQSIFAWTAALRRAASQGSVGGDSPGPELEHTRWQDGLSVLMGKEGESLNMQSGIWP
jgi:hypothetical protein